MIPQARSELTGAELTALDIALCDLVGLPVTERARAVIRRAEETRCEQGGHSRRRQ